MTELREADSLTGGVALLERAINYALGSLHAITPEALDRPTPCAGWGLRALLAHVHGLSRAIPPLLAEELLDLAPLFVDDVADRPARFGPRVAAPPRAAPGDRLVAFLGRTP